VNSSLRRETARSSNRIAHGYVLSDGQFTTIDAPAGATLTLVTGINSRGEIVGRYTTDGVTHAYLLSGGQFNTFDYPGATLTGATAISPRGDIVGRYSDANNVFHGFLLVGFRLACVATP
jgi:probable HAF family extracellular repeat protein